MNKAEIIESVKKLLFSEAVVEQKFAEAKLADGTAIYTDAEAFEVGVDVYVVDADGAKVPVFDAEHVLEDGSVVVTVDGKITEVKPKSEDEAPAEEVAEEVPVDAIKMSSDVEARFIALENRLLKMEEEKNLLSTELTKKEEDFNKVKEATMLLAEEFSKTPDGEKIEVSKGGFEQKLSKAQTKENKLMNLMKFINQK